MCAQDFLFYANAFVWTYDMRIVKAPIRPFITYDFQEEAMVLLYEAFGFTEKAPFDVFFDKSRDMGASWICLIMFDWACRFHDYLSFLMISRKEDCVEKRGDPKALFSKLDLIETHLPAFLRANRSRKDLHLENMDTHSTIDGEATTATSGTSDRRTAILLDEFAKVDNGEQMLASTADVTQCRIFNSTPNGTGNAFYLLSRSSITKRRFLWDLHPVKGAGAYTSVDGDIEILDASYRFPTGYPFIRDGKKRSPWYDAEERRRVSKLEMSQEVDCSYIGSGNPWFDLEAIEACRKQFVRPPYARGQILFDEQTGEYKGFELQPDAGPMRLWTVLDGNGRIPREEDSFVIGVDVSAGTEASNSAICVGNPQTGEKVAEFVTNRMAPHALAPACIAICHLFNDAFLIWEHNGPGIIFANVVIELGYRNFYLRRKEQTLSKRVSDAPGWYPTVQAKLEVLGELRRAYAGRTLVDRSSECYDEAQEYVHDFTHGVEYNRAQSATEDPTARNANHGDRVIATALMWWAMKRFAAAPRPKRDAPEHCFASRRQVRVDRIRGRVSW